MNQTVNNFGGLLLSFVCIVIVKSNLTRKCSGCSCSNATSCVSHVPSAGCVNTVTCCSIIFTLYTVHSITSVISDTHTHTPHPTPPPPPHTHTHIHVDTYGSTVAHVTSDYYTCRLRSNNSNGGYTENVILVLLTC